MKLKSEEIRRQSETAYKQWGKQWRSHAEIHKQFEMKSLEDFRYVGMGKPVILVGNGASLEEEIDTLIEYSGKVDIFCCDKTLGHLISRGIKVTYCMVCDANVNYEKYMKPYENELQDTVLFQNICGNPEWTINGNWKDRYFFANKDILKSEEEFMGISGCKNAIPAATNVSGAMVVFMTQSDERGRQNFFGYDKMLLVGFDYSWKLNGSYYAFDKQGDGKHNYMRHLIGYDRDGNLACTSNNLMFSAKWLSDYITAFNLPVVQCSNEGVTGIKVSKKLKDQIEYSFKEHNSEIAKELHNNIAEYSYKLNQWQKRLGNILEDHELNMIKSTV